MLKSVSKSLLLATDYHVGGLYVTLNNEVPFLHIETTNMIMLECSGMFSIVILIACFSS